MPDVSTDLRIFNDFDRNPELLKKFDKVLEAYSAAAIFADVQYRTGVMDSAIKPAFRAKVTGQAVTVQLSKGDLVNIEIDQNTITVVNTVKRTLATKISS